MNAREITNVRGGLWLGAYGQIPGPGHSPRDRSTKIWDGYDGNVMVHSFANHGWKEVKSDLCEQGLLAEWQGANHHDQNDVKQRRQRALQRRQQRDEEQRAEAVKKTRAARDTFEKAGLAMGSVVETYTRGRGITIELPPSIRCAHRLKHGPTGLILPAMVAAVQNSANYITGIHRTFLTLDGNMKATVSDNKMMLGPCSGGAVRLALARDGICVGEGIETMLSVQQETGLPCWAALTTSGLKALILPNHITDVTICADADDPGERAAQVAAERWIKEGRHVRIARPPRGLDFNDMLGRGPCDEGGMA